MNFVKFYLLSCALSNQLETLPDLDNHLECSVLQYRKCLMRSVLSISLPEKTSSELDKFAKSTGWSKSGIVKRIEGSLSLESTIA
jgi:hypothetical protein